MAEANRAVGDQKKISADSLDQLFRKAHTHSAWLSKPVSLDLLKEIYDLARLGPTSANSSPARFVFVTTPEAKARLLPAVLPGNLDKTKSAPVTVIVAWDTAFHEKLLQLFPARDMRSIFSANPTLIHDTAFRNSSLQGAYFILAARALGLDAGPMSGFDNAKVDQAFFEESSWKSNFLCNIGYGDAAKLHPRGPRLSFDQACLIA
jgi:3-hydroxypropanoate dehydrogenase